MAKIQIGTDFSDREVDEIVTFLGCLTGMLPEGFECAPVLPADRTDSPVSAPNRFRQARPLGNGRYPMKKWVGRHFQISHAPPQGKKCPWSHPCLDS